MFKLAVSADMQARSPPLKVFLHIVTQVPGAAFKFHFHGSLIKLAASAVEFLCWHGHIDVI